MPRFLYDLRFPGRFHRFKFHSQETPYLLSFFAGLAAGTFLAVFLYHSFDREAAYYLEMLERSADLNKQESRDLFTHIFRQRLIFAGIAWLAGLTVYAPFIFGIFTAGTGFSLGFIISVITAGKGLMGLPVFLMTVMPQALFYLPLCALLFWWALQRKKRFKIPLFFLLLILTAAGSACETWLNPFFLKLIL